MVVPRLCESPISSSVSLALPICVPHLLPVPWAPADHRTHLALVQRTWDGASEARELSHDADGKGEESELGGSEHGNRAVEVCVCVCEVTVRRDERMDFFRAPGGLSLFSDARPVDSRGVCGGVG